MLVQISHLTPPQRLAAAYSIVSMAPAVPRFAPVLFLFLLWSSSQGTVVRADGQGFEVVTVETLMPATVCSESKVPSGNCLRVVHRFGPCSSSGGGGPPDDDRTFGEDWLRVSYLRNRTRLANVTRNASVHDVRASQVVNLQASSVATGLYVVTIGIGTPKRDQTVFFDTGSDLCWLQCSSSYPQREPIFDPSRSFSYRNVSCRAPACTLLPPHNRDCTRNTSTCIYQIRYPDNSTTVGFLATERLVLTPTEAFPNFVFGCGQNITGNYRRAAGMFGLGRGFHSLVTQTAGRLDNIFSYCLPSTASSTGYLTLGRRMSPSTVYTPMLPGTRAYPNMYFIDLIGISVASTRLSISPTVFRSVGTLMDSATVVSRLPAAAYIELRAAFRSGMSRYRQAPPLPLLDTCYDIDRQDFLYPKIMLHFNGGANLLLRPSQVFHMTSASTYCLAFAAAGAGEVGIIGSIQQRGMEVILDIRTQRIGFSPGTNCH